MREAVQVLDQGLRGETVSLAGNYSRIDRLPMSPRPVQLPKLRWRFDRFGEICTDAGLDPMTMQCYLVGWADDRPFDPLPPPSPSDWSGRQQTGMTAWPWDVI